MLIENEYALEDVVYLKTDTEQKPRIVTAIKVIVGGAIIYELTQCSFVSAHYECELNPTKDYSISGV